MLENQIIGCTDEYRPHRVPVSLRTRLCPLCETVVCLGKHTSCGPNCSPLPNRFYRCQEIVDDENRYINVCV